MIYNNKRKKNIFKRIRHNIANLQPPVSQRSTSLLDIPYVTKRDDFSHKLLINRVLDNLDT